MPNRDGSSQHGGCCSKMVKVKGIKKQLDFSVLIENLKAVLERWNGKNRQTEKAEFFGQLMDTVESYLIS